MNNLSLNINKGDIVALIGPNGSGKTTLIRTILNLYNEDSGSITILSKDVRKNFEEIGPFIGLMIEESGVYELLTAEEYLAFILGLISNCSKNEIKEKIAEVLKKVNLYDKRNDKIKTFSKGMIQRLAFARAIINKPALLILDEPFDGIDIEAKIQLLNIIKQEKEQMGILITSHNLKELEDICTRIAIIKHGEILLDDTTEVIRNRNNLYSKLKLQFDTIYSEEDIKKILGVGNYNPTDNLFEISIGNKKEKERILEKLQNSKLKLIDLCEEKVSLEQLYLNIINK
ncbi:ABC transporter ATP-binding protein [Clostridium subterminale]|uniref:ABC transporter ATP-binding protein n=1 Tax=Clostridium subterminale TaxID=1550 RepID=UPI0031DFF47B